VSKSPGHRQQPKHKVVATRVCAHVQARVAGDVVAESDDVIQVNEDDNPIRYYFPRTDVKMELLSPTETTTECPFKGKARYFDLRTDDATLDAAVWSYEEPFEELAELKDRVAFYEDEVPEIEIRMM
jgi:uncharacterized protein (DUF427 family)